MRQIWTPLGRPARTGRIRTLFRGPRTAPSSFGNVLVPRELRSPANDWGRTPVVCGRSTFWTENAVLDAHSRSLCAAGMPDRIAPVPKRHHEARGLSLWEQSPAPQPPQTSQTPQPPQTPQVRPRAPCDLGAPAHTSGPPRTPPAKRTADARPTGSSLTLPHRVLQSSSTGLSEGVSGHWWAISTGLLAVRRRWAEHSLRPSWTSCPICGMCVTTARIRCPNGVLAH